MVKKAVAEKAPVKLVPTKKAVKKTPKKAEENIDHGNGRKILYQSVNVAVYNGDTPNGPLSIDVAKNLVGWTEVAEDDKAKDDYDLKDHHGKKIRLNNNITNRPFRVSLARTWEGEILAGNWQFNGETLIIGRTGLCLDCQHRLVGLIMAGQWWTMHKDDKENYPELDAIKSLPVMDAIIVFGISEESKVVDTINTGEPRTLADVLFRDRQYFDDLSKGDRAKVAKLAEHAIRMLASRTAAFEDAFSPNQTHSQMVEFLHRHERLLKCVRTIWDAASGNTNISDIVPLSAAAALMFLMGSEDSDGIIYNDAQAPNEEMLNWDKWDLAEKFWDQFEDPKAIFPIKSALAGIAECSESISRAERIATVIKAWQLFANNAKMTVESLVLQYRQDGDERYLDEYPTLSPIDVDIHAADAPAEKEEETPVEEPEAVKQPKPIVKKAKGPIVEGEKVWVKETPVEASWIGNLVEISGKNARVNPNKGLAGHGKPVAVLYSQLMREQPV